MGILETDVVVMDQVRSFLSNDFGIHDGQGQQIGTIRTEGGVGTRMFMGNRELAVLDGDGSLLFRLVDPPNLGFDTFEIQNAEGGVLGTIRKNFTFFTKSLSVSMHTGEQVEVKGDLFDYEITVTGPAGQAAQVSRRWPGVAQFLLSRERYVVAMAEGLPPAERYATLGSVIALDLIRAKERNSG